MSINVDIKKPFVDYYNQKNIIPVHQDLTDFESFLLRRDFLYQSLGVPLRQLKNKRIIEFGPGGGFNAIATSFYHPSQLVFVDATFASLQQLRAKHAESKYNADQVEIIESNIFDYQDSRLFDLVICEGTIPGQNEPEKMLKHIGSFCDTGAILVITTISSTSLLSEICRRSLRPAIMQAKKSFAEQTTLAASVFQHHLDSLGTSTRSANDWVQDVILHDWHTGKYSFTMKDAVQTLNEDFQFYNSSPRFLTDGRWYKKVSKTSETMNDLLNHQHRALNAFLLDYRVAMQDVLTISDSARLDAIETISQAICRTHDDLTHSNCFTLLPDLLHLLHELHNTLPAPFACTKESIKSYIHAAPQFADGDFNCDFGEFSRWWGRGQQYISMIKTT